MDIDKRLARVERQCRCGENLFMLAVLIVVTGCQTGATLISTSEGLGGIQKGPKWGVVQYPIYPNHPNLANESMENARHQMENFCVPQNYRVVNQQMRSNTESTFYQGSGGSYKKQVMFVRFECAGLLTSQKQKEIAERKEMERKSKAKAKGRIDL